MKDVIKIGDWVYGTLLVDSSFALGFAKMVLPDRVRAHIVECDLPENIGKEYTLCDIRLASPSNPDPRLMAEFALITGDKEDFMYWSGMLRANQEKVKTSP